jgi:hypothetical protein
MTIELTTASRAMLELLTQPPDGIDVAELAMRLHAALAGYSPYEMAPDPMLIEAACRYALAADFHRSSQQAWIDYAENAAVHLDGPDSDHALTASLAAATLYTRHQRPEDAYQRRQHAYEIYRGQDRDHHAEQLLPDLAVAAQHAGRCRLAQRYATQLIGADRDTAPAAASLYRLAVAVGILVGCGHDDLATDAVHSHHPATGGLSIRQPCAEELDRLHERVDLTLSDLIVGFHPCTASGRYASLLASQRLPVATWISLIVHAEPDGCAGHTRAAAPAARTSTRH